MVSPVHSGCLGTAALHRACLLESASDVVGQVQRLRLELSSFSRPNRRRSGDRLDLHPVTAGAEYEADASVVRDVAETSGDVDDALLALPQRVRLSELSRGSLRERTTRMLCDVDAHHRYQPAEL